MRSVYGPVDFSKVPKSTSTSMSPAALEAQKRLAEKYGIQTFDRQGNVTFDGTKVEEAPKKQTVQKSTSVFEPIQPAYAEPQIQTVQQVLPQPRQTILPSTTIEPVLQLREQQDFIGPREFSSPPSLYDFQSVSQPVRQETFGKRPTQNIDKQINRLDKKLDNINNEMLNEANRIRTLSDNPNINVENEQQLLQLSNRYRSLYNERQSVIVALDDAEGEKKRRESPIKKLVDFFEIEDDKSPNIFNWAQIGDAEGFNYGIPTVEAIPPINDEIAEIDSSLQRMDKDSQGLTNAPILMDPVEEQLQALKNSGASLGNLAKPKSVLQFDEKTGDVILGGGMVRQSGLDADDIATLEKIYREKAEKKAKEIDPMSDALNDQIEYENYEQEREEFSPVMDADLQQQQLPDVQPQIQRPELQQSTSWIEEQLNKFKPKNFDAYAQIPNTSVPGTLPQTGAVEVSDANGNVLATFTTQQEADNFIAKQEARTTVVTTIEKDGKEVQKARTFSTPESATKFIERIKTPDDYSDYATKMGNAGELKPISASSLTLFPFAGSGVLVGVPSEIAPAPRPGDTTYQIDQSGIGQYSEPPPVIMPKPITADIFKDPIGFFGQIGVQASEGAAAPIVNIGELGKAAITKEGDILDRINTVQYRDTAFDRTIGAITEGFKGYEPVNLPKPSDNQVIDVFRAIPAHLSGLNRQFGEPVIDPKTGKATTRFLQGVGPAFESLGQDIYKNPVYYGAGLATDVASFILPPLLAGKAVQATATGARTAAKVYAIASVATGGGGKGVSFLTSKTSLKALAAGKSPLIIGQKEVDEFLKKGVETGRGVKITDVEKNTPDWAKREGEKMRENTLEIASQLEKNTAKNTILEPTELAKSFDRTEMRISPVTGRYEEIPIRQAIDVDGRPIKSDLGTQEFLVSQSRSSYDTSKVSNIRQSLIKDLEKYGKKEGVITDDEIKRLRNPEQDTLTLPVDRSIINKLKEKINDPTIPEEKRLEIQNKISDFETFDIGLSNFNESSSLFYRDPLSLTTQSIYSPTSGVNSLTGQFGSSLGKIPEIAKSQQLKNIVAGDYRVSTNTLNESLPKTNSQLDKLKKNKSLLDAQRADMLDPLNNEMKKLQQLKKDGVKEVGSGKIDDLVKQLEQEIERTEDTFKPAYKSYEAELEKIKTIPQETSTSISNILGTPIRGGEKYDLYDITPTQTNTKLEQQNIFDLPIFSETNSNFSSIKPRSNIPIEDINYFKSGSDDLDKLITRSIDTKAKVTKGENLIAKPRDDLKIGRQYRKSNKTTETDLDEELYSIKNELKQAEFTQNPAEYYDKIKISRDRLLELREQTDVSDKKMRELFGSTITNLDNAIKPTNRLEESISELPLSYDVAKTFLKETDETPSWRVIPQTYNRQGQSVKYLDEIVPLNPKLVEGLGLGDSKMYVVTTKRADTKKWYMKLKKGSKPPEVKTTRQVVVFSSPYGKMGGSVRIEGLESLGADNLKQLQNALGIGEVKTDDSGKLFAYAYKNVEKAFDARIEDSVTGVKDSSGNIIYDAKDAEKLKTNQKILDALTVGKENPKLKPTVNKTKWNKTQVYKFKGLSKELKKEIGTDKWGQISEFEGRRLYNKLLKEQDTLNEKYTTAKKIAQQNELKEIEENIDNLRFKQGQNVFEGFKDVGEVIDFTRETKKTGRDFILFEIFKNGVSNENKIVEKMLKIAPNQEQTLIGISEQNVVESLKNLKREKFIIDITIPDKTGKGNTQWVLTKKGREHITNSPFMKVDVGEVQGPATRSGRLPQIAKTNVFSKTKEISKAESELEKTLNKFTLSKNTDRENLVQYNTDVNDAALKLANVSKEHAIGVKAKNNVLLLNIEKNIDAKYADQLIKVENIAYDFADDGADFMDNLLHSTMSYDNTPINKMELTNTLKTIAEKRAQKSLGPNQKEAFENLLLVEQSLDDAKTKLNKINKGELSPVEELEREAEELRGIVEKETAQKMFPKFTSYGNDGQRIGTAPRAQTKKIEIAKDKLKSVEKELERLSRNDNQIGSTKEEIEKQLVKLEEDKVLALKKFVGAKWRDNIDATVRDPAYLLYLSKGIESNTNKITKLKEVYLEGVLSDKAKLTKEKEELRKLIDINYAASKPGVIADETQKLTAGQVRKSMRDLIKDAEKDGIKFQEVVVNIKPKKGESLNDALGKQIVDLEYDSKTGTYYSPFTIKDDTITTKVWKAGKINNRTPLNKNKELEKKYGDEMTKLQSKLIELNPKLSDVYRMEQELIDKKAIKTELVERLDTVEKWIKNLGIKESDESPFLIENKFVKSNLLEKDAKKESLKNKGIKTNIQQQNPTDKITTSSVSLKKLIDQPYIVPTQTKNIDEKRINAFKQMEDVVYDKNLNAMSWVDEPEYKVIDVNGIKRIVEITKDNPKDVLGKSLGTDTFNVFKNTIPENIAEAIGDNDESKKWAFVQFSRLKKSLKDNIEGLDDVIENKETIKTQAEKDAKELADIINEEIIEKRVEKLYPDEMIKVSNIIGDTSEEAKRAVILRNKLINEQTKVTEQIEPNMIEYWLKSKENREQIQKELPSIINSVLYNVDRPKFMEKTAKSVLKSMANKDKKYRNVDIKDVMKITERERGSFGANAYDVADELELKWNEKRIELANEYKSRLTDKLSKIVGGEMVTISKEKSLPVSYVSKERMTVLPKFIKDGKIVTSAKSKYKAFKLGEENDKELADQLRLTLGELRTKISGAHGSSVPLIENKIESLNSIVDDMYKDSEKIKILRGEQKRATFNIEEIKKSIDEDQLLTPELKKFASGEKTYSDIIPILETILEEKSKKSIDLGLKEGRIRKSIKYLTNETKKQQAKLDARTKTENLGGRAITRDTTQLKFGFTELLDTPELQSWIYKGMQEEPPRQVTDIFKASKGVTGQGRSHEEILTVDSDALKIFSDIEKGQNKAGILGDVERGFSDPRDNFIGRAIAENREYKKAWAEWMRSPAGVGTAPKKSLKTKFLTTLLQLENPRARRVVQDLTNLDFELTPLGPRAVTTDDIGVKIAPLAEEDAVIKHLIQKKLNPDSMEKVLKYWSGDKNVIKQINYSQGTEQPVLNKKFKDTLAELNITEREVSPEILFNVKQTGKFSKADEEYLRQISNKTKKIKNIKNEISELGIDKNDVDTWLESQDLIKRYTDVTVREKDDVLSLDYINNQIKNLTQERRVAYDKAKRKGMLTNDVKTSVKHYDVRIGLLKASKTRVENVLKQRGIDSNYMDTITNQFGGKLKDLKQAEIEKINLTTAYNRLKETEYIGSLKSSKEKIQTKPLSKTKLDVKDALKHYKKSEQYKSEAEKLAIKKHDLEEEYARTARDIKGIGSIDEYAIDRIITGQFDSSSISGTGDLLKKLVQKDEAYLKKLKLQKDKPIVIKDDDGNTIRTFRGKDITSISNDDIKKVENRIEINKAKQNVWEKLNTDKNLITKLESDIKKIKNNPDQVEVLREKTLLLNELKRRTESLSNIDLLNVDSTTSKVVNINVKDGAEGTVRQVKFKGKQNASRVPSLTTGEISYKIKTDKNIKNLNKLVKIHDEMKKVDNARLELEELASKEFGAATTEGISAIQKDIIFATELDKVYPRLPTGDRGGKIRSIIDSKGTILKPGKPTDLKRITNITFDPINRVTYKRTSINSKDRIENVLNAKPSNFEENVAKQVVQGTEQILEKNKQKTLEAVRESKKVTDFEKQIKRQNLINEIKKKRKSDPYLFGTGLAEGGVFAERWLAQSPYTAQDAYGEVSVESTVPLPGTPIRPFGPEFKQPQTQKSFEVIRSQELNKLNIINPVKDIAGLKTGPLIDFKSITDVGIKQTPLLGQKTGLVPRLTTVQTPIVDTKLIINTRQTPKLKTELLQQPKLISTQKQLFTRPQPVPEKTIPRFPVPLLPVVPFWLQAGKEKRKEPKPKKSKKAKIAWAVPDWWGGYYDPEEYRVVKGATTPKKFLTGNWGFDTE